MTPWWQSTAPNTLTVRQPNFPVSVICISEWSRKIGGLYHSTGTGGHGLSNSHAHGRERGWGDWVIVTTAPLHACFLQIYWFFWPNVINRETKCYPYLMEQKLSCSSDYKTNNALNLQLIDAASRCLHFLASLNDICCHLGIPFLLLIHLRGRWFWLQEFLCFDCGSFFIYNVIDSRINWVIWDRPLNDRINNH